MLELDLHATGYNIVAMFDGRVLEIFGPLSDDSSRAHVKFLSLSVAGPDKKGRRDIWLKRGGEMLFLGSPSSTMRSSRQLSRCLTH